MDINTLNNKIVYLILLFGLLIGALCYFPGLSGHFVLDDFENIVNNKELTIEQVDVANLAQAAFSQSTKIHGRPLSMVSFALNQFYFGNDPYSYKVTNLLIHLCNSILVFIFSYLLVFAINTKNSYTKLNITPTWFALVISMLWLVHPINLTSVLYVVQRMTSLAAFFGLLSIIFYLLFRLRQQKYKIISIVLLTLSAIFLIASILCKENGILVVLFLLLIEVYIFKIFSNEKLFSKKLIVVYSILLTIPCMVFTHRLISIWGTFVSVYDSRYFTLADRLFTELRVVSSYIKWIIIPNIKELSLYHDGILISKSLFNPISTFISFLFLSFLTFLVFYLRKKAPLVSFGLALFFAGHLLESTVIPLEIAFEHRNYLPSIGILISLLSAIFYRFRFSMKIFSGLLVFFVFVSATTYARSERWSNPLYFAEVSVAAKPESLRAQMTRANIYYQLYLSGEYKDKEKVLEYFNQACKTSKYEISPDISRLIASKFLDISIPDSWYDEIYSTLNNYPITTGELVNLNNLVNHFNANPRHYEKTKLDNLFKHAFLNKYINNNNNAKAKLLTLYGNYISSDINSYPTVYRLQQEALNLNPSEPRLIVNLANTALLLGKFEEVEKLIRRLDGLTLITYTRSDVKNLKKNYERILKNSSNSDS